MLTTTLAVFALLFILVLARIPIGVSMAVSGAVGYMSVVGLKPALSVLASTPIRTAVDPALGLIPLFILMGTAATASGLSADLYRAGRYWVGHFKGGLAIATIAASAGFAALCGSSVAGAATMSKIALPPMRSFGYDSGLAAGTVAAGGTLGILIPPSVALALYGILTEQDIRLLFIAGILPGVLAVAMHMITIAVIARLYPGQLPAAERVGWGDRFASLVPLMPVAAIFVSVIGGMYGGLFTPTEAAAIGAVLTIAAGFARRSLGMAQLFDALIEAARLTASVFLILIGALIFGYFLAITRVPQDIAAYVGLLGLGVHGTLIVLLIGYLLLGCILDSLAMIVLTIPIVFPMVVSLGIDPIWFGVLVVVAIEVGLISPPIGMNVFVISNVEKDIPITRIFRGVLPFVAADIARLALMLAFPALVLFLPRLMA